MKIRTLLPALLLFSGLAFSQVGIGTTDPDVNSVLEIASTDKGLLMPRVALTATNSSSPLGAHVAGMTVYNTATAGSGATAVKPGFYVNDGTKWIRTYTTDGSVDAKWVNKLSGSVELLTLSNGTTTRPPGKEFVALDNGNVGIGTNTATDKLTVVADSIATGISITGGETATKALNFLNLGAMGQGQIDWRKPGTIKNPLAASIRSVGNDTYGNKGLAFYTGYNEDDTDAVEQMRLTPSGRLGIGTTNPDSRVHIAYDPNLQGLNVEGISFDVGSDNKALISHIYALTIQNTGVNRVLTVQSKEGSLVLNTKNASPGGMLFKSGDVTRMEIVMTSANNYDGIAMYDNGGNVTAQFGRAGKVGIGTAAPTEKLEINGAIKIGDGGYTGVTNGATTPTPTGGNGTIIFTGGHFYGWDGTAWRQMDN